MTQYRLKDRVEIVDDRLGIVKLANLTDVDLHALIEQIIEVMKLEKAFQNQHYKAYEYFDELVLNLAEKFPKNTDVEKASVVIILTILMENKEAIIGLSERKEKVTVNLVNGRLIATVHDNDITQLS